VEWKIERLISLTPNPSPIERGAKKNIFTKYNNASDISGAFFCLPQRRENDEVLRRDL
jgi:hypothetical protein